MKKMRRKENYRRSTLFLAVLSLFVGLAYIPSGVFGQSGSSNEVGWKTWGGALGNQKYPQFDQINASNFSKLEVAWRFKTTNMGPRPEYKLEGTPLMVH